MCGAGVHNGQSSMEARCCCFAPSPLQQCCSCTVFHISILQLSVQDPEVVSLRLCHNSYETWGRLLSQLSILTMHLVQ